ncbi:MAG TPA: mechanosensitive ion channel family protein [Candidatus Saccharimonadales bacterium]|nr:mechanosensitive ion channel family protein [Candidatus Saccharimonadales bacterium]
MFQYFSAETNVRTELMEVRNIFQSIVEKFFNLESVIALVVFLSIAFIAGRIIAAALRKVVAIIGRQADKTEDLGTVNRLRRYETVIVLSIAVIRTLLVLFALYFWWVFTSPGTQPTALIASSALLAILIGGALTPTLRDISGGAFMMVEQWYGVGDHVRIEPFMDMQGVVERVTLRSTRIRGLNGEVIWVNNQYIQAVRLTPKGIRTMALELFVRDLAQGEELINMVNRRMPTGPLLVISPLSVMTSQQVGEKLWHLTAIAETAPGREWLIERYAVDVLKEIDEDKDGNLQMLATEPVARFADGDAERRFARALQNARKAPKKKRPIIKPPLSMSGE